jgi:hypothetical protein
MTARLSQVARFFYGVHHFRSQEMTTKKKSTPTELRLSAVTEKKKKKKKNHPKALDPSVFTIESKRLFFDSAVDVRRKRWVTVHSPEGPARADDE